MMQKLIMMLFLIDSLFLVGSLQAREKALGTRLGCISDMR